MWWGMAYVSCVTNLPALYAWAIRWHVTDMLINCHWHGRWALSNHVWAHSVVSMGHVICLQHLARACSEQSRSTSVLPINHVIQMPQCLSRFVNHNYSPSMGFLPDTQNYRLRMCLECRERFPRHGSLALTTCITACMWHSVMHGRSAK